MAKKNEWFGTWFDSPYYHILYKHRDHEEAAEFINNLCTYFHFTENDEVMDLACGKGRHSIFLNKKGYDVTGLDLSPKNIAFANTCSNDKLRFFVHDMRDVFAENKFDYVLNMFTSFGYFDDAAENERAIAAVGKSLKRGGKFILDFMNAKKVIGNLVEAETKLIEDVEFEITRELDDHNFIVKNIKFEDRGRRYEFHERVKAISFMEFQDYFDNANLKCINVFGDYQLNPYNEEVSDRMIFVLEK